MVAFVVVVIAVAAPVAWWLTRTAVTCGIVVGIDQTSITDVTGFTIRSADGVVSSFSIVAARLAPDSFEPGHLREHRALAEPICVIFRPAESPRVALDLTDALAP
jgi:hypothetical protein